MYKPVILPDGRKRGKSAMPETNNNPLKRQIGGAHYMAMKIQPIEYITKNNIPYIEGNIIKYISRHTAKGGLQDLEKARHYLDMLILECETAHES
ncbi:MAG: DUF3310 domain-containing protein [Ghiorsea sp.]